MIKKLLLVITKNDLDSNRKCYSCKKPIPLEGEYGRFYDGFDERCVFKSHCMECTKAKKKELDTDENIILGITVKGKLPKSTILRKLNS